jgi:hypothetical protein
MNFTSGPIEFRVAQVAREVVAAGLVIVSLTRTDSGDCWLWLTDRVAINVPMGDGRLPFVLGPGPKPCLGRLSSDNLIADVKSALEQP